MNERGFFQDVDFEELFDHMEFMPATPIDEPPRMADLVARRWALGVDWGMKGMKLAHVLPQFLGHCEGRDVRLLATSRERGRSVASWSRWTTAPFDQPAEEVIDRAAEAIRLATSGSSVLTVDFDRLVDDPAGQVGQIARHVGREVTRAAVGFVDATLRHG